MQVDNDISRDFADDLGPDNPKHYTLLVDETHFDHTHGRSATEGCSTGQILKLRPAEHNTNDGGRGVYLEEPIGHFPEIITRPYGSGT